MPFGGAPPEVRKQAEPGTFFISEDLFVPGVSA